jgi:hypothetical protein
MKCHVEQIESRLYTTSTMTLARAAVYNALESLGIVTQLALPMLDKQELAVRTTLHAMLAIDPLPSGQPSEKWSSRHQASADATKEKSTSNFRHSPRSSITAV